MKRQIDSFLKKEKKYASLISKEIMKQLEEEAGPENIEYSFTISRTSGKISNKDPNTFFVFDTKDGTEINNFKKALFAKDLADIQKDSPEEQEIMEKIRNFIVKICKNITENYKDKLKDIIRKAVLDNRVGEETTPLKEIEIVNIDIADFSSVPESSKYLLKIGKKPGAHIDTDYVVEYIQDKQEETGKSIKEIVDTEKMCGNPQFEDIISVEKGRKYLNDITLFMFVDYSLNLEEENV